MPESRICVRMRSDRRWLWLFVNKTWKFIHSLWTATKFRWR